jgi:hypothetical protein
MDVLPLMVEAIGLLPPTRRWEATFSTYYTSLPPGVICNWRFVIKGSPEDLQSRRSVQALRIDLCDELPAAAGGALVTLARTGLPPMDAPSEPDESVPEDTASDYGEQATSTPAIDLVQGHAAGEVAERIPSPAGEGFEISPDGARFLSGMPPPPPPAYRKRQRLAALYVEEFRRRQWLTGIAAATALIAASVGFGMWMRSGTGVVRPEIIAVQHGADDRTSETTVSEPNPEDDEHGGKGPAEGTAVNPATSAKGREQPPTTGSDEEIKDTIRNLPDADPSDEEDQPDRDPPSSPGDNRDQHRKIDGTDRLDQEPRRG